MYFRFFSIFKLAFLCGQLHKPEETAVRPTKPMSNKTRHGKAWVMNRSSFKHWCCSGLQKDKYLRIIQIYVSHKNLNFSWCWEEIYFSLEVWIEQNLHLEF